MSLRSLRNLQKLSSAGGSAILRAHKHKANDVYFGLKADGEIGFSKSKTLTKTLKLGGYCFFYGSQWYVGD